MPFAAADAGDVGRNRVEAAKIVEEPAGQPIGRERFLNVLDVQGFGAGKIHRRPRRTHRTSIDAFANATAVPTEGRIRIEGRRRRTGTAIIGPRVTFMKRRVQLTTFVSVVAAAVVALTAG